MRKMIGETTSYRMLLMMAIVGSAACLTILVTAAKPAEAAYPGTNGPIAYVNGSDVMMVSPNGGTPSNVTKSPSVREENPVVSPDGKTIAYQAWDGNDYEIYKIPVSGGTPTKVTDSTENDDAPSFSPDGTQIAYSGFDGTDWEIYTIPAAGGSPSNLTNDTTHQKADQLAWSPDGKSIAYTYGSIYAVPATGGTPAKLYSHPGSAIWKFDYSPDSKQIVFSASDGSDDELYTLPATGGTASKLTFNGASDYYPVFSPDGTKVAFTQSVPDGNGNTLSTMPASGGSPTQSIANFSGYDIDWGVSVPDTTAPAVSLTAPAEGAFLSDSSVALSAVASDDTGVEKVDFLIGGTVVATDTTAGTGGSYSVSWDSTTVSDGQMAVEARAYDKAGNEKVSSSRTVTVDNTAPGAVAGLSATPGNAKADLSWIKLTASDLDKVRVLRSTSAAATSPEPGSSQTQVYEGTATSYSDTGLTNDTTYYYTVFARDTAGNWSSAMSVSATPKAPDTLNPSVSTTTPTLKTGVSRTKPNITATFSEPVDNATVAGTSTSVKLINTATGKQVGATVSCDADPCTKVTITPNKALAANTKHKVTITSDVKDLAGNALDQNQTTMGNQQKNWTFTTAK